ncbi:fluoride efflux transporter CrcB [Maribacter sp. 2-571]|uniref:fluoride efflux transporter CrcB n=1 Tax=Maribacter sp. 2-571 TaxID=3417569 RepID=UPI003D33B75D
MKPVLLIFLGGGVGSVLRYVIGKAFNNYFEHFFLGTFLVNGVGCLLIGLIMGLSLKNGLLSSNQLLILVTGFCGGFTTFSTYALEGHSLLRSGDLWSSALYLFASLGVGILAVALGLWSAKLL